MNRGQTMSEYALVVIAIAIFCFTAFKMFGLIVDDPVIDNPQNVVHLLGGPIGNGGD